MRTKTLSSWLAAGALLTTVFASGCKTKPESIPHPPNQNNKETRTIPHPPNETKDSNGDQRHRRHRERSINVTSTPPPSITHPGG